MRLTTRLMQMASWLLLQRAVNNGEMNRDQVLAEKNKVRLDSFNCDRNAPGWATCPKHSVISSSIRCASRTVWQFLIAKSIARRRPQALRRTMKTRFRPSSTSCRRSSAKR
jgi:hypothetical protein